MSEIILGTNKLTDAEVAFDSSALARHLHLIGSTGSGKTTAILTIIRQILSQTYEPTCLFLIDPMGNLSMDLLRWMANKRDCPKSVRDRLLYLEPAREEVVMTFNPLISFSPANEFYKVERAVSLIQRAWEGQDLSAMPRLRRWCFNSFLALARLGLPIAMSQYLLHPGSHEHKALLRILPTDLRYEWEDILRAKGGEAIKILDSTRNRLEPFFRSVILKRMFGSRVSRFDVERFIQERRIVILNLASYRRVPQHLASTIGALALNEILETALSMPRPADSMVYLLLDEFQKFVGPDIYDAIPTVRQKNIRLILSHQSLSQLDTDSVDLTGLIWQPRNRLMFSCDAYDADRLAHEIAHLKFDPMTIKHQLFSHRQRLVGHEKQWLVTQSKTVSSGSSWQEAHGTGNNQQENESRKLFANEFNPTRTKGGGTSVTNSKASGGSLGEAEATGAHEVLVPIHEEVAELSKVMFKSFEEERIEWGKELRTLNTGETLAKFYNDREIYPVRVNEDPIPDSPKLRAAVEELIQKNFESDVFISAALADQEAEQIRLSLFESPTIVIPAGLLSHAAATKLPVDNSGLE